MKLAKALKEKNRLVGEINRLKSLIQRENSRNVKSSSTVDVADLWNKMDEATEKLIAIKTAIFNCNIGIYDKIVRMSELKDQIGWIDRLPTNNDRTEQIFGERTVVTEFKAYKTREDIDNMTKELQDQIAKLQDELDEYNATVQINPCNLP